MVDIRKYGIEPFGQTPDERQLEHLRLGKKAFFHFGINTFTDAEAQMLELAFVGGLPERLDPVFFNINHC